MNNRFLKALAEGFIENLPTILTGTSVVTGLSTIGYSIWSGWRIKEITEDEAIDNKTKAKKIALLSTPTLLGAITSSGCAIGAQMENSKRLAALAIGGVAGAATLVSDDTKDKVLDLVDKDKKIHRAKRKDVKSDISVGNNETIEVKDNVTGYRFKTTLADLWFTANRFNDDLINQIGWNETMALDEFYERLLGSNYETVPAHSLIKFGNKDSINGGDPVILSIQLDSELGDGLKPIYTIDYDYID